VRTCTLAFDPPPARLDAAGADYQLALTPGARIELSLVVTANVEPAPAPRTLTIFDAAKRRRAPVERLDQEATRIRTNHDLFDHWLLRSRQDLHLLLTETPEGFVPYAGIPWYVAPFGRDSLMVSLQNLLIYPDFGIARPSNLVTFDVNSQAFVSVSGATVSPDWIIIPTSPLSAYTVRPDELATIASSGYARDTTISATDGAEMSDWFDQQDPFFMPFTTFTMRDRPGPEIQIFRRRR